MINILQVAGVIHSIFRFTPVPSCRDVIYDLNIIARKALLWSRHNNILRQR